MLALFKHRNRGVHIPHSLKYMVGLWNYIFDCKGDKVTEQQIQRKIIQFLEKEKNAYVVKVMSATKSGVPDILCCISGIFIGIEVKTPKTSKNTSALQDYNLDLIKKKGGLSLVAWNVPMVNDFLECNEL